ncbi:hypothetical protein NFA_39010 [Nocardia farcinica IFM 10152]|uniref:Uncharacterized protein n=1 Tax=Nocardia farcinica (strain IFM 10152) TaxID=247156 RepID=Q5YSU2_NOCFA|nr:hypothetical protein NFA_39010 [Nocardia farcinica IFM 10152]
MLVGCSQFADTRRKRIHPRSVVDGLDQHPVSVAQVVDLDHCEHLRPTGADQHLVTFPVRHRPRLSLHLRAPRSSQRCWTSGALFVVLAVC